MMPLRHHFYRLMMVILEGQTCLCPHHTNRIYNLQEDLQIWCLVQCLYLDRLNLHHRQIHKLDIHTSYFFSFTLFLRNPLRHVYKVGKYNLLVSYLLHRHNRTLYTRNLFSFPYLVLA